MNQNGFSATSYGELVFSVNETSSLLTILSQLKVSILEIKK